MAAKSIVPAATVGNWKMGAFNAHPNKTVKRRVVVSVLWHKANIFSIFLFRMRALHRIFPEQFRGNLTMFEVFVNIFKMFEINFIKKKITSIKS